MRRRDLLAGSGALAAAAIAGCLDGGALTGDATVDLPSGEASATDLRLAELADGNAAFALDLHGHLAAEQGGNQFLSPYSISVALAMTYAGARGETREQIRETLRYTLDEEVHPAFSDLQSTLDERGDIPEHAYPDQDVDGFQLDVANSLWGLEDYPFDEEFLDRLEEHYGAGFREADFVGDPEGERERINDWVADATEDRIDELLPAGSLDPTTRLVLTNAIYFLAGWNDEFDPSATEEETFTTLDGTESEVATMETSLTAPYASLDGLEVVELPYVGEEVSMVLLLPAEGQFRTVERALDGPALLGVFEALETGQGTVALPRFEFESTLQLSDALEELGMPVAFENGANFTGMLEDAEEELAIDEVYHDTFVAVDEEGTEAAGATAVVVEALDDGPDTGPPDWGELRFDRPFLFCVRDRPTDAVLFLGRVVDADAAQPVG